MDKLNPNFLSSDIIITKIPNGRILRQFSIIFEFFRWIEL